ncbi:DUF6538 domain-containing protein [Jiella avicenniae]|uniref:Tyrosine-type recombinase/integrase n=1 Tax=Jiella avicenniae TaxID=2907202 RepID=A0A9X1TCZ8_9HYPH|nr:tyrosine-type recombinase/integrase [Jiella avicenniae]MCE7029533.1 tyrosine-type recombinase/integrase [Jiella avicenniae]
MAGRIKGLIDRNGRFYVRIVIPADLRSFFDGKTELRTPLGPDRREALRRHPAALATLLDSIDHARTLKVHSEGVEAARRERASSPLAIEEIARRHYAERLAFDEELRGDPRYAQQGFDDGLVADLKDAIAGKATNEQLANLVGFSLERFRKRGNHDARFGSPEWRSLARSLSLAELEAMRRVAERDEGDFSGSTNIPALAPADEPAPEPPAKRVSIEKLFDAYLDELNKAGKGAEARKRWAPVVKDLIRFLKHDDANRLTKSDLIAWRDHLSTRLSLKTVKDVYVGATKAVLSWAHENEKITSNPADGLRVRVEKKPQSREKGFTESEARTILQAARDYQPVHSDNPQTRETEEMVVAKRWVPWLCAFTGARVAEITQLRFDDVREADGVHYVRISPAAGSVKGWQYRDVPLHHQLLDMGFLDFVKSHGPGPLFYREGKRRTTAEHPSKRIANKIGRWVRTIPGNPADVAPSHGWRHRLKTIAWEVGIDSRVVDAIQGHAARTAGENYGDVTLKARKMAIDKLPRFE